MSNVFERLIKNISGTKQRQKSIVRVFLYSIVIISLTFFLMAFFINVKNIKDYSKIITKGSEVERQIISLDVNISKINNDKFKTNKIISNNKLFHNLNDISVFINSVSSIIEKEEYLVQFKVLDTLKDSDFDIYKTQVKFEFVNVNSSGDGYRKVMSAINNILKESKKKIDITDLKVLGNFNDIGKVELIMTMWCDFKYDNHSKVLK